MSRAVIPAPPASSPSPVPGSCCSTPRTPMAFASIWRANQARPSRPAWLQLLGWVGTASPLSLPFMLSTWLMGVRIVSWGCRDRDLAGNQHRHRTRVAIPGPLRCSVRHRGITSARMTWPWPPITPAPLIGWWGWTQCHSKLLQVWTFPGACVSLLGMLLVPPRPCPLTGPILCNGCCSPSNQVLNLHFQLHLLSQHRNHPPARAPPPTLHLTPSNQGHLSRQSLVSSVGRPLSSRVT